MLAVNVVSDLCLFGFVANIIIMTIGLDFCVPEVTFAFVLK